MGWVKIWPPRPSLKLNFSWYFPPVSVAVIGRVFLFLKLSTIFELKSILWWTKSFVHFSTYFGLLSESNNFPLWSHPLLLTLYAPEICINTYIIFNIFFTHILYFIFSYVSWKHVLNSLVLHGYRLPRLKRMFTFTSLCCGF